MELKKSHFYIIIANAYPEYIAPSDFRMYPYNPDPDVIYEELKS